MTDNQNTPDVFASLMRPWIVQLRMITEGLAGISRLSESALSQPLRSLRGLPLPGAVSAAQLDSFAGGIAAQRTSIAALQCVGTPPGSRMTRVFLRITEGRPARTAGQHPHGRGAGPRHPWPAGVNASTGGNTFKTVRPRQSGPYRCTAII